MHPKLMLWNRKGWHRRYGSPTRLQESAQFERVGHGTLDGDDGDSNSWFWFREEPTHGSGSGHGITFRSRRDPRRKFWENVNKIASHRSNSVCENDNNVASQHSDTASQRSDTERPIDDVLRTSPTLRSRYNWENIYTKEHKPHDKNYKTRSYERESSVLRSSYHARYSVNTWERHQYYYSREHRYDRSYKRSYERERERERESSVLSATSHRARSVSTWERHHYSSREHRYDSSYNKKYYERESSLGWKKKWSSSSGRYDSQGAAGDGREKKVNIEEEIAANETEETKKKPRLNWGEGLAKFEKKNNTEGDDGVSAAATPTSSVACSSFPGVDDKLDAKAANVDDDDKGAANLGGSTGPDFQIHQQKIFSSSEKMDANFLNELRSTIAKLRPSNNPCSADSTPAGSTASMTKLMIWKNVISKLTETTATEIHSLENELKLLQSDESDEEGNVEKMHLSSNSPEKTAITNIPKAEPVIKAVSSCDKDTLHKAIVSYNTKTAKSASAVFDKLMPNELKSLQSDESDEGNGTATTPMIKAVSSCDADYTNADFYTCTDDTLQNTIAASNRETAKSANAELDKLMPNESGKKKISNVGVRSSSLSHSDALIMKEKMAEKKRFGEFKEKVLTVKYKAFDHLWKKDLCLRSMKKLTKINAQSNLQLGLQTVSNKPQRNRSAIHKRFHFPAGNRLSMVPTFEMIDVTENLVLGYKDDVKRRVLKMPGLILDEKDKKISRFNSRNGLVEDPLGVEKERAMINPWTSEEREIFLQKFAAFGKDFRKIASFIEHKTTADCLVFYYKIHKPSCLKKDKKKKVSNKSAQKLPKKSKSTSCSMAPIKKRNRKTNVSSNEKPSGEAPANASSVTSNTRRTRSGRLLLWRKPEVTNTTATVADNERESSAITEDALVGVSDSLPPTVTSTVEVADHGVDETESAAIAAHALVSISNSTPLKAMSVDAEAADLLGVNDSLPPTVTSAAEAADHGVDEMERAANVAHALVSISNSTPPKATSVDAEAVHLVGVNDCLPPTATSTAEAADHGVDETENAANAAHTLVSISKSTPPKAMNVDAEVADLVGVNDSLPPTATSIAEAADHSVDETESTANAGHALVSICNSIPPKAMSVDAEATDHGVDEIESAANAAHALVSISNSIPPKAMSVDAAATNLGAVEMERVAVAVDALVGIGGSVSVPPKAVSVTEAMNSGTKTNEDEQPSSGMNSNCNDEYSKLVEFRNLLAELNAATESVASPEKIVEPSHSHSPASVVEAANSGVETNEDKQPSFSMNSNRSDEYSKPVEYRNLLAELNAAIESVASPEKIVEPIHPHSAAPESRLTTETVQDPLPNAADTTLQNTADACALLEKATAQENQANADVSCSGSVTEPPPSETPPPANRVVFRLFGKDIIISS